MAATVQPQTIAPGVKDSLVKYDTPVLVTGNKPKPKAALPKFDRHSVATSEDVLAAIVAPRQWKVDGQVWEQSLSSTPATRIDVINLQEQLDLRLQQRQARETGLCPIREELYSQCFDEIIRQVTVQTAERGLLLVRVRDEIRLTIAAYQSLYESSIAFGMRKALMAEQRKSDLASRTKILTAEVAELEAQVQQLTARCEELEASEKERYAADEERHAAEVARLASVNAQLQQSLEAILMPPSVAKK